MFKVGDIVKLKNNGNRKRNYQYYRIKEITQNGLLIIEGLTNGLIFTTTIDNAEIDYPYVRELKLSKIKK